MTNNVLANVQNLIPPNGPARPKKKKKKSKAKSTRTTEGTIYGHYHCSKCKARWTSPNSVQGVTQECKKCATAVLPNISPPGKKLTPYQGRQRCFGEYKCTGCSKTWSSGNSWADMGQECKDCLINIYPHMQRPLRKKKGDNTIIKRHLNEHCEKCKTLGGICTRRRDAAE